MANTDRKKWSTPKLRVFVRTKAEERVLWQCKESSGPSQGPVGWKDLCYANASCTSRCQAVAGS